MEENLESNQKTVLVVDDEIAIVELLKHHLTLEGYNVLEANDGISAVEIAMKKRPDLILLDIMLPKLDGLSVCKRVKNVYNVPVLMITAKDTENDMLTGFSVGGDDYISKPFSIKEVIARIKAILKRNSDTNDKESVRKLVFDELIIDLEIKEVELKEEKISLTKTEFEILALLAENPERLFSRAEIIEKAWSEMTYVTERTVDVHITRLRKKLGSYSSFITNRSGYGYRFKTEL